MDVKYTIITTLGDMYVRLTICVKKRKDMQKFFLSFEYFESDEWKWVLGSVRISECPWAFSNFETIIKSDWQTVKAFFTSTVHEITANGFLTYKTTHFQIFFPNLNNNRRMIKNVHVLSKNKAQFFF